MVRRVERERGNEVWVDRVANEASGCVGVYSNHEEECKVMRVPENLESLLPNLVVGRGIHEHHDEEHEVASDATRLRVVNLLGCLLANLSALNIDEVDIVGSSMYHSPEGHRVGNLPVEPDIFIGREEPGDLGTDDADDIAQHGNENEATIKGEN